MTEKAHGRSERAGREHHARARNRPAVAGDRRAVIVFLLRMLVGWAIATGLLSFLPGIDAWAVSATVASVGWTLRLASLHPVIEGTTIALGGVALRIIPECTPVMPSLLLGIAMAAYPSPAGPKLVAWMTGALALWAYNVLRMLALMATLAWWPGAFRFVHVYLWQTVTLLVVCALFVLWLRVEAARADRA
jgi:exosortase/archaeosortase family protein